MKELYDRSMARTSFALVMLAIAAALALGLGLIGIYGVISYVVSQQGREIGIRLARRRTRVTEADVPAARPDACRHRSYRRPCHGPYIDAIHVLAVVRHRQLDATTYVAVLAILLTAGDLASYMPARRCGGRPS